MAGKDILKKLLYDTKLKSVMETPVIKIYEDGELSQAQEIFTSHNIHHLPVCDRNDRLVGVLSHKYLYKTQSPRKLLNDETVYRKDVILDGDSYYDKETLDRYILRKMMNHSPFTMKPDDSLGECISNMARLRLGCIIVVDNDRKVLGMLSEHDVVKLVARFI